MKIDTVPGWVIRDEDGNLTGLKCPLSGKSFWGETCERDQYHYTLSIYEKQGMDEPIGVYERKQMYNKGIGR